VRVEFIDDWLLRRVDVNASRGVRFMDKIKERIRK